MLYLIEILHQTTTSSFEISSFVCCILLKFYIKPQLYGMKQSDGMSCILLKFYIKPQREVNDHIRSFRCILLKFYIKPQRQALNRLIYCIIYQDYHH